MQMEKKYKLNIHHINRDKADNGIKNLILFPNIGKHNNLHIEFKEFWLTIHRKWQSNKEYWLHSFVRI